MPSSAPGSPAIASAGLDVRSTTVAAGSASQAPPSLLAPSAEASEPEPLSASGAPPSAPGPASGLPQPTATSARATVQILTWPPGGDAWESQYKTRTSALPAQKGGDARSREPG